MSDLLFDTPWWLLAILIGGGGYIWYVGNSRMDKSWKAGGIAVAAVGVLLALTSWLVVTDKEYCEKQTRQIIEAASHHDWTTLEKLLDPQSSVEAIYNNRDQIIAGAKKTIDTIGLTSASITSMQVKQADTVITADLAILSYQDATMGRPVITSWRFDWENTGGGWRLVRIEPLQSDQVSKQDLIARLQRP